MLLKIPMVSVFSIPKNHLWNVNKCMYIHDVGKFSVIDVLAICVSWLRLSLSIYMCIHAIALAIRLYMVNVHGERGKYYDYTTNLYFTVDNHDTLTPSLSIHSVCVRECLNVFLFHFGTEPNRIEPTGRTLSAHITVCIGARRYATIGLILGDSDGWQHLHWIPPFFFGIFPIKFKISTANTKRQFNKYSEKFQSLWKKKFTAFFLVHRFWNDPW